MQSFAYISVTLWILAGNRKARTVEQNGEMVRYRNRENEVLFIDLRQWGEPFEKKYIQFTSEQIKQVADNFHNWQREGHGKTYRDMSEYCDSTVDSTKIYFLYFFAEKFAYIRKK